MKQGAKSKVLFGVLLPLLGLGGNFLAAREIPSDEMLVEMVPKSSDMADLKDIENFQYLVGLGEKAYPALVGRLLQTQDPVEASNIIGIFRQSSGEKSVPAEAISRTIERWKPSSIEEKIAIMNSIAALGEIGTSKEAETVFKVLSGSHDMDIEIYGLRSLAKLGDLSMATKIENWRQKCQSRYSRTEQADAVLQEAKDAIESINRRKTHP